jgi:hypothetical protein
MLTALLKTVKATSADAPVAPLVVISLRFPVTSRFRAETRPQFTRCRATDTLKPKCLKSLKISRVVGAELASQRYAAPVGQSHGATAASSLRQPQMARCACRTRPAAQHSGGTVPPDSTYPRHGISACCTPWSTTTARTNSAAGLAVEEAVSELWILESRGEEIGSSGVYNGGVFCSTSFAILF